MKKLRREATRVGGQVTDAVKAVEPAIRHTIQKIDVKFELDSHRDAARVAVESAEKEFAEMEQVLATANSIETDIKIRLEQAGTSPAASEDNEKSLNEKLSIIRGNVQKLSETQAKIAAEKETVSTERGKVSSLPNEVENPDAAKEQAKAACSQAQRSAAAITNMLEQARGDLRNIQAAQQEILTLIPPAYDAERDKPDNVVEIHGSLPAANSLNSLAGAQEGAPDLKALSEQLAAVEQTLRTMSEAKQRKYQTEVLAGRILGQKQILKMQSLLSLTTQVAGMQRLIDNPQSKTSSASKSL